MSHPEIKPPFRCPRIGGPTLTVLAAVLASAAPSSAARASEGTSSSSSTSKTHGRAPTTPAKSTTSAEWHAGKGLSLKRNWGIDIVAIHPVSSGLMLRFDYRVVDPDRAAVLTDKRMRPYLIHEATRTALAIPAMEKVGELRQVAPLEANRTYFMIFGNPGRLVKPGHRVTLVAGNLRVEGLVVN